MKYPTEKANRGCTQSLFTTRTTSGNAPRYGERIILEYTFQFTNLDCRPDSRQPIARASQLVSKVLPIAAEYQAGASENAAMRNSGASKIVIAADAIPRLTPARKINGGHKM